MASDVSICNRALYKLGATTAIISLDEDSKNAAVMKNAFVAVRDAELRRRRWRFSLARASLAADSESPPFGFDYQYPLPSDFLQLVQVGEFDLGPNLNDLRNAPTELYSIEGRKILTHFTAPLKIRYVRRITDAGLFDSAFCESFAARLAYEACEAITQSSSKKADCLLDYRMSIREAIRSNALEVAASEPSDDTWIAARSRG